MAMEIVNYKSPVLYAVAKQVTEEEMGESLDKFMSQMATMMYSRQGVGLAGPQVGSDLRILVADLGYVAGGTYGKELVKMVNPVLLSISDDKLKTEEQCISYGELKVPVERPTSITVSYLTPFGERKEVVYNDWQARVILHEMDHLDGVTLYSRLSSVSKKRYDAKVKSK